MFEQMIEKAKQMKAEDLMGEIKRLNDSFDEVSTMVSDAMLHALEGKLPENKYVEFCDAL